MKICRIDGCGRESDRRKMCKIHYRQWLKSSDPSERKTRNGVPKKWIEEHTNFVGEECLMWPFGKDSWGYARIRARNEHGETKQDHVHAIMLKLTQGERPDGYVARHLCGYGMKGCVNPRHLAWGTHQENQQDRIVHGTDVRGSKNGYSILKEFQIFEIRKKLEDGITHRVIASEYGVDISLISLIRRGKAWSWLSSGPDELA